jgi:chromosomal replication initiator protein
MTAVAVAENPGKVYNPLFIYGKSGVGKTHLMHAIGNYIKDNSNKTVLYVSIDTFINDFININVARKNDDNQDLVEQFKDKYRNVDVLIIDDIQLLSNATKTQGEFFNTFEYLHQSNKQIIVSSDRSPDDLKLLEDRLRTRFAWGLTVCISPPDYDLRIKILKNKLIGLEISSMMKDEVLEYIANNFDSDVRHLEGALNTIYANVSLMKPKEINLEFAVEVLRPNIGSNIYITNNVAKIQKAVADYFNITVENLKSKKRTANINLARQIAMYICKMTTDETLDRIGLEFNRDHATVIHATDKIESELKTNEERIKQIKEIKEIIAN